MLHCDLELERPLALRAQIREAAPWLGLLGASGAGKTSLLRALAGLAPSRGSVRLDGRALTPAECRRQVALVSQEPPLVPHWNLERHCHQVRRRLGGDIRLALELQESLELEPLMCHRPDQLSGGERRRVALALALMRRPRMLLLDEAFAALDDASRLRLYPRLQSLVTRLGIQVVLVAHQIQDVARLCQEVAILEKGRIRVQDALATGIRRYQGHAAPCSILEASTLSASAREGLVAARLGEQRIWMRGLSAPLAGRPVRLLIPADEVAISLDRRDGISMLNQLAVRIQALRETDGGILVDCDCAGQSLQARISRTSQRRLALRRGLTVYLLFKASAVELLGPLPE